MHADEEEQVKYAAASLREILSHCCCPPSPPELPKAQRARLPPPPLLPPYAQSADSDIPIRAAGQRQTREKCWLRCCARDALVRRAFSMPCAFLPGRTHIHSRLTPYKGIGREQHDCCCCVLAEQAPPPPLSLSLSLSLPLQ